MFALPIISFMKQNETRTVEIAKEVLGDGVFPLPSARNSFSTAQAATLFLYEQEPPSDHEGMYPPPNRVSISASFNSWDDKTEIWVYSNSGSTSFHVEGSGDDGYTLARKLRFTTEQEGETQFRTLMEHIRDTYRKPVSSGCIQAFLTECSLLWVSKRPTSNKIAEHEGKFYLIDEGYGNFVKVYDSLDEDDAGRWVHTTVTATRSFRNEYSQAVVHGSYKFVKNTLLTPIYTTYVRDVDAVGLIARRMMREAAERQYRQYTRPSGQVIFVDEPLPYSEYNKVPVHSYSTRIESLVQPEDLFKMGKVDLYRRRPEQEVPYLGFELEACANTSAVGIESTALKMKELMPLQVICKADSSIQPAGFETVSVPATLDYWKESSLSSTLDTMRKAPFNMRSYEHASCGFHVHVSRRALSVLDLQKLERFMHSVHNRDFLSQVAGRGPCTYANYYEGTLGTEARKKAVKDRLLNAGGDYYNSGSLEPVKRTAAATSAYLWSMYEENSHLTSSKIHLARQIWHVYRVETAFGRDVYDTLRFWRARGYQTFPTPITTEEELISALIEKARHHSDPQVANMLKVVLAVVYPEREFDFHTPDATPQQGELSEHAKILQALEKLPKKSYKRTDNYETCREMLGPIGKCATGRYDVLNTTGKNTVEFRLFKGTMNPDSVFRYLEFVDAMVRFLPSTSASDEGLTFEKFLEWIVKDSFNSLRYSNLVAFCVKNGFIERKLVRRKEVPQPVESDGLEDSPTVVVEADDDEEIYEPDEDDYDGGSCDCDDCRRYRGELVD